MEDNEPENVTYVDIYVIRVSVNETGPFVFVGEFDLVARCTNMNSYILLNLDDVGEGAICTITVQMESDVDSTSLTISHNGKVVVSVIEAEVEVGT